jgi:hypothetical protein
MNYVSFSPNFPPNYYPFCVNLRKLGVTVLGLFDAPYDSLRPELKAGLNEYYKVSNAHNYDELVRGMGYFTHRYGKIDRLESHNEYWLESDARLRTDFNIPGFHNEDMARIKRKSEMKKVYIKAGIPVARGLIIRTLEEAKAFVDEVGFPIVAKPDIGVGAYKTYKLHSQAELDNFFNNKPLEDYIFEEFIEGHIQTFDGLVNQDGKIVFSSTMVFKEGVMDLVNESLDFWYYTMREIPEELEKAGHKLVTAYHLRERFFHFEFFCTPSSGMVALEVNLRPPGGLTTDMWNYANDIDIYKEYANVVVTNCFNAVVERPYYCGYVGRRNNREYLHPHNEVIASFPQHLVHYEPISGIFSSAIGDYGYLIRSPDWDELSDISAWILQKPEFPVHRPGKTRR